MSSFCEPAVLDFPCTAEVVWQTLCDPSSYKSWYGFPSPHAVTDAEAVFAIGAKLHFDGSATSTIVTAFRPCEALTLSSGSGDDRFTILENETGGCRVCLVTSLNGRTDWAGTAEAKTLTNLEILRALRSHVCKDEVFETAEPIAQVPVSKERGLLSRILTPLFYGYKNPLKRRSKTMFDDSVELANIVDNTEGDVVLHLRAALAGLLLAVILFSCLSVCVRFEGSDIVTSSGLSVVESNLVTLQSAQNIYIGQTRNELERMLSCRGTRVSSSDYIYYSTKRDAAGRSLFEIRVTYDAYGNVRRYSYLDLVQSALTLPITVDDYTQKLDAAMTPEQAAEQLGLPVSAYWHDKSGATTIFFGRLDIERNLYDPTLTSQLVVTLSPQSTEPVKTAFFSAFDPRNTMPFSDLNKQYRRQFSSEVVFRADRAAYERLFLIVGLDRHQVDTLLGTEQVEIATTANTGLLCSYQTRSLFADAENFRYCYNVTYDFNDTAIEVSMQNGFLETREGTLLSYDSYAIYEGATLYELYSTMGLLPTYAVSDGETLTLCYGRRTELRGNAPIPDLYDLTVRLDLSTLTVTSYRFNHV